jgi:L,D-transpeptidase ErfK/SrfK
MLAPRGCSTGGPLHKRRHFLEDPPPSPDLVEKLRFREAKAEDTLIDLAPELGVGYVELLAANPGVDPWLPPDGTRLVVPSVRLLPSGRREGIVINLGDLHLYFFEPGQPVRAYPIGIAKDGYATPLGVTQVKDKKEKPTWVPGPSARRDGYPAVVKPGPDNPLGEYALYLGDQSLEIDETGKLAEPKAPADLRALVKRAAGKDAKRLDWARIDRAGLRRSGVPLRITQPVGTPSTSSADAREPR